MSGSPTPRRPLILAVGVALLLAVFVFLMMRGKTNAPTVTAPTVESAGFRDIAGQAGISFRMGFLPNEQGATFKINLYDHGCGLAVGDYDGDGHDDVYFLSQLGPNALYRNKGDGTFEDVTSQLGLALDDRICVGATFADYDNDGDQDLYVTSTRGGNVLFRNEQNRRFQDVTDQVGLRHVGHSQTAVFFDYDKDSLLDLYLVQTSQWTSSTYDESAGYYLGKGGEDGLGGVLAATKEYNILYRNQGDGTFSDVTEAANLKGRGWSGDVAVFDYDQDGWLDVLVTSMFGRAQLYRNRGDASFEDVTLDVLGRTPFGGIGAKVFDFNNDGMLDIYIVDMHSDMWMGLDFSQSSLSTAVQSEKIKFDYFYGPNVEGSPHYQQLEDELEDILDFRHDEVIFGNAFYKCLGEGRFAEISDQCNMETFWPWGIATGDFDNDGYQDAFVASGMGYPFYYWRNYLMMNDGKEAFAERSSALGTEPPAGGHFMEETINGVPCARSSRCTVTADFDSDGRLEIMTNNFNHEPYYFKNELPRRNYIAFRLRGTRSNRDAIGALVRIVSGNDIMLRQVQAAGGYLSHSSKTVHFGLGERTKIDRVEISWPSGTQQTLENVEPNRLHEIVESEEASAVEQTPPQEK